MISTYDARIDEKQILTPPPADRPRINGPRVYGARPNKVFIYRIPTQGKRPMTFRVEGMPETMELNPENGIIRGVTPDQKGRYPMTVYARNAFGEDSRPFSLVVGDKLALTPPTGWNHWGGHASNVSAEIIRAAADFFVEKGLADVGFRFIGIDDCWMRMSPDTHESIFSDPALEAEYMRKHVGIDFGKTVGPARDEQGNILTNGFFPDMEGLVEYIHSCGLLAGIYSSPGPLTCQRLAGSEDHERQDARQYAAWGFDLLKYDQCSAGKKINEAKEQDPPVHPKTFWRPMAEYLEQTDRDFVYNLCQYGGDEPWTWAPGIGVHTWRIGGDLNHNVSDYFDQAIRISVELRRYNGPGRWNDPDFIYVGRQVQTRDNHFVESSPTGLDTNQEYQYVTLWAMVCAPFFFSTDVRNVSDFTINLLRNPDVMAISQDELAHTAEVIRDADNRVVMCKKLVNDALALAVCNRDGQDEATVEVSWTDLGDRSEYEVTDLWRQTSLGTYHEGIAVHLSANGVALLKLE